MKTALSLILCVATVSAKAGDFVNLTFNEPDLSRLRISPTTGFPSAPVSDLLRGWEVSLRQPGGEWSRFQGEIGFSFLGGGGPPIALNTHMHLDPKDYGVFFNVLPAIGFPPGPTPPDVRLSTKGSVPERALTFDWYGGRGGPITISDDVSTVTTEPFATTIDVSQFAGKEVTISVFQISGGRSEFDVIGFSVVPEPETWALLGVGLVGLFAWRQYKRA